MDTETKVIAGLVVLALVFGAGEAAGIGIAAPWREIYDDWKRAYEATEEEAREAGAALKKATDLPGELARAAFRTWLRAWDPLNLFNPETNTFGSVPEGAAESDVDEGGL
jgi:hypothetical protein